MIYSFISSTDIDWSLATCQVLCLQQDSCFKEACTLGEKAGNQQAAHQYRKQVRVEGSAKEETARRLGECAGDSLLSGQGGERTPPGRCRAG